MSQGIKSQVMPNNTQQVDFLKDVLQKISSEKLQLQKEIDTLQSQIDQAFKDFKLLKYSLQSILVHEGSAGKQKYKHFFCQLDCGHYYAYINDFEKKIWRKYSDIQVTVENKETVKINSFGGASNSSAYFLVYLIDSAIRPLNNNKPLKRNALSSQNVKQSDEIYSMWINPDQVRKVKQDNATFKEEINDYQQDLQVDGILEKYQNKKIYISDIQSKYQNFLANKVGIRKPPLLLNFCVYLTSQQDQNLQQIIDWVILDGCVIETFSKKLSLRDLGQRNNEIFTRKLQNKLNGKQGVICFQILFKVIFLRHLHQYQASKNKKYQRKKKQNVKMISLRQQQ